MSNMEISEDSKFCRVCLAPEEAEKFKSIFDDNGKLAMKIYRIAGILLMDIDEKIPSLICGKCVGDIEAVDKLKFRILDADEYFTMMTLESEKRFLDNDMKKLVKPGIKTPLKQKTATTKISKSSAVPDHIKANNKQKPAVVNENMNPRKRKYHDEDIYQKPIGTPNKPSMPKATPNKLGIHRMIIKAKKTKVVNTPSPPQELTPASASKTKKTFKPKLSFGNSSRSKKKRSNKEPKTISFECDSCKICFDNYQALNDHIASHDFMDPMA